MNKIAPCKNCTDHRPHCHSSCERYAEYCKDNERLRELEQDEKAMRGYQHETKMRLRKYNKTYD